MDKTYLEIYFVVYLIILDTSLFAQASASKFVALNSSTNFWPECDSLIYPKNFKHFQVPFCVAGSSQKVIVESYEVLDFDGI